MLYITNDEVSRYGAAGKAHDMDGQIDVFTLLTLVVAVVVIFKLRSVLGRRTGDEETRLEQRARDLSNQPRNEPAPAQDKVVTLRRDRAAPAPVEAAEPVVNEAEERIKAMGGNTALTDGLLDILIADPAFHRDQFLAGAKQAYEMIVTSFADGKLLQDLLAPSVAEDFARAIADREKHGEKVEQTFVGINRSEIIEAGMDKGTARITVRFVSELINATRDKSGTVIAGDPENVKSATDLWIFGRDISSARARRQLNWKLLSTEPLN